MGLFCFGRINTKKDGFVIQGKIFKFPFVLADIGWLLKYILL